MNRGTLSHVLTVGLAGCGVTCVGLYPTPAGRWAGAAALTLSAAAGWVAAVARGRRRGRAARGTTAAVAAPAGKDVAELKNDFVSMVSHELRTPLASIKAYAEMLIDGEAVDAQTTGEFYEVIQNEANRLGRLIDNILAVSRIESGVICVDKQPHDLNAIVRDAVEVIAPQARQKDVRLAARVARAVYQTRADRDMIYQAVLNLLSNAVKYTPAGGTVTVETGTDAAAGTVAARVTDTGVGIPPKDLPFVFDKFYRAEANSRVAHGTGLGLSLVRQIVETVHGGRMVAHSEVGKGSCFGFELARCDGDDGKDDAAAGEAEGACE